MNKIDTDKVTSGLKGLASTAAIMNAIKGQGAQHPIGGTTVKPNDEQPSVDAGEEPEL